jgi:hypothetical protein
MDGQLESGVQTVAAAGLEPVRDQATELHRAVSEELLAAWRNHFGRLEQELQSGWQEQIRFIVTQRFPEGAPAPQAGTQVPELEHQLLEHRLEDARHQATAQLNHVMAPFHRVAQRPAWVRALAGAGERYARRVVVLMLRQSDEPLAARALDLDYDSGKALPSEPVPLCYAPAILSAMESGRPVVAVRSGAEISVALENMLGPGADRAQIFPLRAHGESFGVLYAEGVDDSGAMEAIAAVAGLSAAANREILRQASFERPAAVTASPRPSTWNELPAGEQEIHLRAHRFARTQAAQLRLYRAQEVREGRAAANLYGILQEPIDQARRAYQEQFVVGCESMVDYFHSELVKTLANNDERLLGGGYPGPLQ